MQSILFQNSLLILQSLPFLFTIGSSVDEYKNHRMNIYHSYSYSSISYLVFSYSKFTFGGSCLFYFSNFEKVITSIIAYSLQIHFNFYGIDPLMCSFIFMIRNINNINSKRKFMSFICSKCRFPLY